MQCVVLSKALFKLVSYFRSVFLYAASFVPQWRVLCYKLIPLVVPDGKHDISSSGNHMLAFVSQIKGVCIYDAYLS